MKIPTSPLAGTAAGTNGAELAVPNHRSSAWHQSLWFALAISLIAGFFYALLVMGPRPLNPRNVNWLAFDPAYHYIGWEMFRQDPHLHWPLTYTDRLGYPKGESVALLDLNPLLAVVLKPLSFLLPEPAQYFGLEVILCCTLQFFFAFRLFRLLLEWVSSLRFQGDHLFPQGLKPGALRAGSDRAEAGSFQSAFLKQDVGAALCAAFFLLAPPLNYRFWGHYSLSNQWMLVAGLFVFAQAQERSEEPSPRAVRRFVISATILTAMAFGTNPYLAFQVLLIMMATVVSLLWQHRLTLARAAGVVALLPAVGAAMAYALGLVISGGGGYGSGGYRDFSMNLLAPFDPRGWASVLFPRLHSAAGQYEGYNYLGAGVLVLAAIVILAAILHRGKLLRLDKRWFIPLAVCCLMLALLALSTKVTLSGRTLIDLDPSETLTPYFAPLRASGRLFWTPYYAILAAILAAPFLLLRKAWANVLIAAMLVLQFADTASLRQWVRATISDEHPSPLKSPIWSQLGKLHQNLIVLPAWQCAHNASPGGTEGYRTFGFLAVEQKMRINSYQSARYTRVAQDYHCSQAVKELSQQPLAPDSAYVVTPELAAAIAQGPTGPGKCHDLDRFILCSTRTDFGLSPVLMTSEERLQHAIANPGFEDGDIAPWSTNGAKAKVSTATAHSGTYSLAESGDGTVYQDVNGLTPGATYTLSAWVTASPGPEIPAQLIIYNPTDNSSASSAVVRSAPGWQMLSSSFTVGREGAIRILLARGPAAGTAYWDDVRISAGRKSF